MRAIARAVKGAVLVSIIPLIGGCTYVCHLYQGFQESLPGLAWGVEGRIVRQHAEGKAPTKYSLPHWGAREDDRYRLELVPVSPDSTFWSSGDVDIVDVKVIAGADTISLDWCEREQTYDKVVAERRSLHSASGYYSNVSFSTWYSEYGRELALRRVTFKSEYFSLAKPVPDTLVVEYKILMLDGSSGRVTSQRRLRSEAIVDRHRRWTVVDGIES